eukprot:CCRYP_009881-RA/>CCRYP_009881-RA protein AED:0.04 eAED:0.01 QI:0/0/0/1/1/1/2/0/500
MAAPKNPYVNKSNLSTPSSTLDTNTAASRLATGYRKLRQLPTVITREELEGENLEEYIVCGLGAYCTNNAIPRNFDEYLNSTNEDDNHCCMTTTLLNYIGQHLNYIRVTVYPDHPDFKNLKKDEHPPWYTAFRADFTSACNKFQLLSTGDHLFEGHDTQPLYRDVGDGKYGVNPFGKCDLKRIMTKIFKTATPSNKKHEKAAWIITTQEAIGRPGECKFQDFNDWSYDYLLNVVDTLWKESKTLKKYTMPRFTDEFFGLDWYCVLGAYFMCDDGLFRSPEDISNGKMNAVFPSLHQVQDKAVAKKLTNAIRTNLPDDIPNHVRDRFSAKSLRKGGTTTVSMVGGHSTGTTVDNYIDPSNPVTSFPAANALHGVTTLTALPVLPEMNAVGRHNRPQWEALIDRVFAVNVPHFMPDGRHRVILEVCLASMIRHYESVLEKCGAQSLFVTKLTEAATEVRLRDDAHPGLAPPIVLLEWSKTIRSDFKMRSRLEKNQSNGSGWN